MIVSQQYLTPKQMEGTMRIVGNIIEGIGEQGELLETLSHRILNEDQKSIFFAIRSLVTHNKEVTIDAIVSWISQEPWAAQTILTSFRNTLEQAAANARLEFVRLNRKSSNPLI